MVIWKPNEEKPPVETKAGWRVVTRKEYFFPNGEPRAFDVVGRVGEEAAHIIGLTSDMKVIVAEQFRPGPDASMDELPGGAVDKGEDLKVAAKREFLEETGYEAGTIEYLGSAHNDGYMTCKEHYFIAYDCKKVGDPQPEPNEWIAVKEMTIANFLASAKQGKVTAAAGVLWHTIRCSISRTAATRQSADCNYQTRGDLSSRAFVADVFCRRNAAARAGSAF